jgi:hypothetical protein
VLNLWSETCSALSLIDCRTSDIAELPLDDKGTIDLVLAERAIEYVSAAWGWVIMDYALSETSNDFRTLKLEIVLF